MEESIKDNLTSDIWDVLGLKSVSPRQLSPLVLAYICLLYTSDAADD